MGGGVGQLDRSRLVEPDDADAHQVGQVRRVADLLVELELGRVEPVAETPDQGRHVGRRIGLGGEAGDPSVAGRSEAQPRPARATAARAPSSCRSRSSAIPIATARAIASSPTKPTKIQSIGSSIAQARTGGGTLTVARAAHPTGRPQRRPDPVQPIVAARSTAVAGSRTTLGGPSCVFA